MIFAKNLTFVIFRASETHDVLLRSWSVDH